MESIEIYDSTDNGIYDLMNQDVHGGKQQHRCVTICLGLLCIILLAGNIGQAVCYNINCLASPDAASYNALRQSQNDPLTVEIKRRSENDNLTVANQHLENLLRNLTEHNQQLQQSYRSLTTERDKLESSFKTEKNKTNQLRANYSSLITQCNQLKTSYEVLQRSFKDLQSKNNNLTADIGVVNAKYKDLEREREGLQTRLPLEAKLNQSERNCSSVRKEMDQLRETLDMLNKNISQMKTNYSSLWEKKELLQASYNTLTKEKEELETRCQNLTNSTWPLKIIDKTTETPSELPCPTQWRFFEGKCYYLSTAKKNWTESRRACMAKGADLFIANSHEEQDFVNGLLDMEQNAWIGLTDSLTEGVWIWLDGTQVTTTYWLTGQPNNYKGEQDCGELVRQESGAKWNDDVCFAQQLWICEK